MNVAITLDSQLRSQPREPGPGFESSYSNTAVSKHSSLSCINEYLVTSVPLLNASHRQRSRVNDGMNRSASARSGVEV